MAKWLLPVLLFSFSQSLFASGIKGFIKDENGKALPFATVYIAETSNGAACNENGYYEINLAPGEYTIVFQYLGYTSQTKKITVGGIYKEVDVQLSPQSFELNTVEITDGRENPAYTIIRKAIAKASYHREQVDHYTATVYMKGSGRLLDSPFYLERLLEKEGVDSTTAFLGESVSQIEYQRPNTYKEVVKKIRKQGNDNSTSPMMYITSSFYEPELVETVSPLSPRAFGFYKFDLIGSYIEGDTEINKIKVTPRTRGEGVFEGFISIVEDDWAIHSLDLFTYKLGIKVNVKQVYKPIMPSVWLPINHQFEVTGSFFGFDFIYNYLATVNDYSIQINPDLEAEFTLIDENIEIPEKPASKEKSVSNINGSLKEKLESGEELTRKDLRKLMKEYEKEDRKKMEEPEVVSNYAQEIDSSAYTRDSTYWEEIRPIPLTTYEVKSYKRVDSLAIVEKTEKDSSEAKAERDATGFRFGHLLSGNTYRLDSNDFFRIPSPLSSMEINTVEGFAFNYPLTYEHRYSPDANVKLGIQPRFAFARDRILSGNVFLKSDFGKKFHRKKLTLEGGRMTAQYNEEGAIPKSFNTFLTVMWERNFMKLFEKEYGGLKWSHQLGGNFTYKLKSEYSQRYTLPNSRTRPFINWKNREFTENLPDNVEPRSTIFPKHQFFEVGLEVEWMPFLKYKINNGVKSAIEDSSPALWAGLERAIPDFQGSDVEFLHLYAGVKQHLSLAGGNRLSYQLEGGLFNGIGPISFVDYKHFSGNQTWLTKGDPVSGFLMLPYYQYSTRDQYFSGHIHNQFRNLALTRIPLFWMLGLKENLFVHYLATPSSDNYMEIGYGLDNIYKIFRIEVAVATQDWKYLDFGVFIGISSAIGTNVDSEVDGDGFSISF
ncbi:MAG: DUF5686 and carboxypeptidase regulatory-like domain-containing protein [Saprospiraceae bacterium]